MRVLGIGAALLIATVTVSAAQQKKGAKAPPADDPCGRAATQLDLTQCAGKQREKADAAMEKVYASLLKDLDEDHAPILEKSQKAWVVYRNADCDLYSSQFLGGSAQAQLYDECMAAMAAERTRALKDTRKTLADFVR